MNTTTGTPDPGDEGRETLAEEMTLATDGPPVFALGSLLGELEGDMAMRYEACESGRSFGPITPFATMTMEYGGAIPNGLHIVLGGSGVGKTAYALQLATGCGCPALYVSCEMGRLELFRRLSARGTSTFLGKFKDGSIPASAARTLARRTAEAFPQIAIMDATQIPASRAHIERTARALKTRHAAPFVFVVVDSLHSWAESHAGVTEEREAVASGCRELRVLASVLEAPVLAIAELNREAAKGNASGLSGGAGSRKIEYGSESVLMLEGKEEEEMTGERKVTARFEKNRHGSKGRKVEMTFHGALQRYREAA